MEEFFSIVTVENIPDYFSDHQKQPSRGALRRKF